MAKTIIQGFTVEVEDNGETVDCFVSKGSFCSSLAALQQTGTLENSTCNAHIDVPESVQTRAEEFALANGW